MPRSHLALFQKYFPGSRAGAGSRGRAQRLAVGVRGEQGEVVLEELERHVRGEVVLGCAIAKRALGSGRQSFASSRQWTPSNGVSKRLQRVTQWMSCTLLERAAAR